MERGKRKRITGVVVSDKMDKTRVVAIESWKMAPIYRKRVRSTHRVKAHDEGNQTRIGDTVVLVESRPLSRDKRWRIARVVTTGNDASIAGGDR
ncbi:MAG: 30S ribosomal protein S17 [Bacillota bacterium]|jgi:small subunit ribosomal protein S17